MSLLLDALDWDGITIGGADADLYVGEEGIEGLGQPAYRTQLADRSGEGGAGGSSVRGAGSVSCTAWVDASEGASKDYSKLWDLYTAMNEIYSPLDERPLKWAGLTWPADLELRRWARPAVCDWTVREDDVAGTVTGLKLQWVSADPNTFSDAEGDIVFGGEADDGPVHEKTFTVENNGTRPTRSGGAWTFRLQAHDGPVESPYIMNVDTGEIVTWLGLTVGNGLVLTVDRWRVSRVGSQRVDGYRVSGSSIFPNHPVAYPGEMNTFKVGCASGVFAGNLHPRDVY